ncbi:hypothetical protein J6590_096584 [Homalodisca vitripennis]|nr:hypothetical protein J6590_096584 [Homalodisca vitripennis]
MLINFIKLSLHRPMVNHHFPEDYMKKTIDFLRAIDMADHHFPKDYMKWTINFPRAIAMAD